MKSTTKLSIFFFTFISAWTIIMLLVLPRFVLSGFNTLEEKKSNLEIQQLQHNFTELIQTHRATILDWTKWDSAYEYVQNRNDTFIDENMQDNLYSDLEIDFLLIYNAKDELIVDAGYNRQDRVFTSVPTGMQELIIKYPNESGIFYLNNQPYYFSSSRVTNSENTMPTLGLISFVNILREEDLLSMSGVFDENISVLNFKEEGKLKTPILSTTINYNDSYVIYSYPYVNSDYHLDIKLDLSHEISNLGKKTLLETQVLFIITFFILSYLVYYFIRNIVFKTYKIINEVKDIHSNNDGLKRITVKSKHELGILINAINTMLDKQSDMHQQLNNHARSDALTGLQNRRGGFERLQYLMDNAKINALPLSIAFLDLNNLKHVNDRFGHNIGDEYLLTVTEVISNNIRGTDVFCRLGGDEFLIIFPHCDSLSANETISRSKSELNQINANHIYPYDVSISVGICTYHYDETLIEFIELADKKMYENKRQFKLAKSKATQKGES